MHLFSAITAKKSSILFLCNFFFSDFVYSYSLQNRNINAEIESPPSCEIIIPDGGQYQFNQIHARLFHATKKMEIPEVVKTWQVVCNTSIQLSVRFSDNRVDTSSIGIENNFGLGQVNTHGKLGNYQLILNQFKVDGDLVGLGAINNISQSKTTKGLTVLKNEIYTWLNSDNSLSVGKVFSLNIAVKPILNNLTETNGPIIDGADFDGSADIIFSFGIWFLLLKN
nr:MULTISPECIES: hypothetical protein [Providencia]